MGSIVAGLGDEDCEELRFDALTCLLTAPAVVGLFSPSLCGSFVFRSPAFASQLHNMTHLNVCGAFKAALNALLNGSKRQQSGLVES